MKLFQKIFTKAELIKSLPFFVLSAVIVILDQWSKIAVSKNFYIGESVSIIDGFLKFTYVHNKGAAFSFGHGFSDVVRIGLFKVIPVLVGIYLVYLLIKSQEHLIMKFCYALILGGGAGNVIDRIRLDYVVDFISVYHNGFELFGTKFSPWFFAIFNIADSAVSIAAVLLIIDYFAHKRHADEKSEGKDVSKI